MKKWIVLLAGMCLQTVLGSVYGWSAFVPSLTRDYGLGMGQTGFIFGITIAVFTITMIPAGKLIPKYGPRPVASVGALLYMAGYDTGLNVQRQLLIFSPALALSRVPDRAGYVCPLTTGIKCSRTIKACYRCISGRYRRRSRYMIISIESAHPQ